MSTYNWLLLETLGSGPIMSKNSPQTLLKGQSIFVLGVAMLQERIIGCDCASHSSNKSSMQLYVGLRLIFLDILTLEPQTP